MSNVTAAWHELVLSLLPPKLHFCIVIPAEIPDELISTAVSLGSVMGNNDWSE